MMIVIGIDPGTITGLAAWDAEAREFLKITSMALHRALGWVKNASPVLVLVEDARKRHVFTRMDREQARYGAAVREGVGSVKRDCVIWEEFLTDIGIRAIFRMPRTTKWHAARFTAATGWKERTNEHARDAAMSVFNLNTSMVRAMLQTGTDLSASRRRGATLRAHG